MNTSGTRMAAAAAGRADLWDCGFRPVPIYSFDCRRSWLNPKDAGKRPKGNGWELAARQNPPTAAVTRPEPDALETGILCDGLRVLDLDVDYPDLVGHLRDTATNLLGATIVRYRENSPRIAMLYQAAEGEPEKRVVAGSLGKVEVLGRGQQLVSLGYHPSGVPLQWTPTWPTHTARDALPAVTEDQITAFLAAAAPLLGARPSEVKSAAASEPPHSPSMHGPKADPLDIAAALAVLPNEGPPDWEYWNKVGMATWAATDGSLSGFAAWCAWSERHPAHQDDLCRQRWDHYRHAPPNGIGAGTLFHLAREQNPRWVRPSEAVARSAAAEAYEPLDVVDPRTLADAAVPPRIWIVEDWLPSGHVTLSYGDGGVGKTLLAQQLMTACVTGAYWCGLTVARCKTFALFCEDDPEEVHRRQDRINAAYGVNWHQLGDMRWACAVGADNVLVRFGFDHTMELTPRFVELTNAAKDFGAKLLVIDTAADTFGGNENDRQQVRAFLGPVLTKLARQLGGAVLLNAHPSRSGLSANGDMDGGSTAWSNTARSRWALTRPAAEDGAEPDENLRILSRRKSNYAARGDQIELRWQAGVLQPVRQAAPSGLAAMARRRAGQEKFLDLLQRCGGQNIFVSGSRNAGNFAPKVFSKRPERDGYTQADFEAALNDLLAANRITNQQYGRPGDARFRLARVPDNPEAEVRLAAD